MPHSLKHLKIDKTRLDYWSAQRKDLCLTLHSTHVRQAGFQVAITEIQRPQSHFLDHCDKQFHVN